MVQKQPTTPNNNPNPETHIKEQYQEPIKEEMTVELLAYITPQEKEYYATFISIISKLGLPNGVKIIKDDTFTEFIRTAMAFMSNWYVGTAFKDSNLISILPDKKAKQEFIAFRTKFMNFPIGAQLEELKRMGLVKPKK